LIAVRTALPRIKVSTWAARVPEPGVGRTRLLLRLVGFALAFGLTVFLALDGGGFDVVVRDEVGIVVWAAIAFGFVTGIFPRGHLSTGAWVALGGMGVLTGLTAVAHAWTESDEATTLELARVVQYLGIVTLAYLALDRHTWHGAAAGFAGAALVIPFFALGARLFPHLFVDDVARAFHFDRLSYPLDYWNAVSCWGAMAIAIGLCVSAHGPRVLRAAALAAVPVASLSIYLTFSRFGVIATATAFLAAFAVSRNRWTLTANALVAAAMSAAAILIANQQSEIQNATGNAGAGNVIAILLLGGAACAAVTFLTGDADGIRLSPKRARVALGATALVAVLAAAALHGPISTGWDQFTHSGNVSRESTGRFTSLGGDRYAYWRAAYHAFQSDPARGIGPGTFEFYWSRNGTTDQLIRNPHSLYLQKLAELGLAGFVAIVIALAGLLWGALEARRRWIGEANLAAGGGLIAAFVVFVVYAGVDWIWEIGAIGTLGLGGAAVVGAARFRRAAPLGGWARAGLTLVALVAAASMVPSLVSTQRTRASGTALAQGDPERAVQLADDAVRAEPWAASPHAQKALALQAEGRLAEARDEINRAIDRERTNWRYLLIRAQIDSRAGDRKAAVADLVYAKALAPRSPYLQPNSSFIRGVLGAQPGAQSQLGG
jgi:O-antigen ligase